MTDRFIPDEDDDGRDDEATAASDEVWVIGDDDWADPFEVPGAAHAPAESETAQDPVAPELETPPVDAPVEDGDDWGLVDVAEVVAGDPWSAPVETPAPVSEAVAADPIEDPTREMVVDPLIDWPEDVTDPAGTEEAIPDVAFTIPDVASTFPEESVDTAEGADDESRFVADPVAADPFAGGAFEEDSAADEGDPLFVTESAAAADPFAGGAFEEDSAADEGDPLFAAEPSATDDPFGEVLSEEDLDVEDTLATYGSDTAEAPVEAFTETELAATADPYGEAPTKDESEGVGDDPVDVDPPMDGDAPRFVLESAIAADPFADALSEEDVEAVADSSVVEDADSPEGIEWVFLEEGGERGHWGFVADVVSEGDNLLDVEAAADPDAADELSEAPAADDGGGSPTVVSAIEEEFRLEELRAWEQARAAGPAWRVGADLADENEVPVDDDQAEVEGGAPVEEASKEIIVGGSRDGKPGKRYLADAAWLGGEALARKVLFEVVDGRFVIVKPSSKDKEAKRLRGIVLPGLVNTHSHAFHRLLRGRTHRQGGDFWSWRDRMFEVAIALDPVGYEDVATAVFVEMAMAGITTVGEFHYLHHKIGGLPYRDPNEMGHAMIRAARRAGIRIGLLDAGYLAAGFGRPALHPVQERFSDGTGEAWLERAGLLCEEYADEDDVRIGLAPHSVRAVPDDVLRRLAEWRNPETKLHIHVSEQPAENLSCMAAHGLTPVGLLESAGLLGPNTTAVHATHLTDVDVDILGSTRTGVCLCPTTERDLADGIGPSRALRRAGSTLTVGSDSHSEIDLFEEARGIEHHHRLAAGRRGGFAPATLLEATTVNGADALGFGTHGLQVGAPADFIVLNADSPRLAGLPTRAESVVFAASASDVRDVYVGGKRIVHKGTHPEWKKARKTFKARR